MVSELHGADAIQTDEAESLLDRFIMETHRTMSSAGVIDNKPDFKMGGWQLMVANDVFRARFRESFEKPKPLVPGQVTPITIDLHTQSYKFQKGHRIQVQVQSSWFPIIDRNPQTWMPNIFEAKDSDYQKQTHRVWRTAGTASRVEIATVP